MTIAAGHGLTKLGATRSKAQPWSRLTLDGALGSLSPQGHTVQCSRRPPPPAHGQSPHTQWPGSHRGWRSPHPVGTLCCLEPKYAPEGTDRGKGGWCRAYAGLVCGRRHHCWPSDKPEKKRKNKNSCQAGLMEGPARLPFNTPLMCQGDGLR